ncbi:unannotated protein [freshwater metagenome]|uniref:Unannotated protein n=1 Tax=freshwater metagenome TaxID=449393 RepID=A0A6J6I3T1_9ZZZZ
MATGLVASDEDEKRLADDRLIIETVAIDFRIYEGADEIILWRTRTTVGNDLQLIFAKLDSGVHGGQLHLGCGGPCCSADHVIGPAQEIVVRVGFETEHVSNQK